MEPETQYCQDRQERHTELDSSIDQLGSINRRLQALIERVEGAASPCDPANKTSEISPARCLSAVLNSGPERIQRSIAETCDQISQLENILF